MWTVQSVLKTGIDMKYVDTPKGRFPYQPVYLYVGRKVIDRDVAFENLKELVPVLDAEGMHFGPFLGTLLGIVREHDFIAWDEDIDLYLLQEDEERFLNSLWTLREHGFELVRYDKRGLYSVMRNGEYIDFYILRKLPGGLWYDGGREFIFDRFITDLVPFEFKGISLKIPRDYDGFLTFQYGDWRTPVQYADYQMGPFRIFLGRLFWEMKNLIPKAMYTPFLKAYHWNDWRKFRQKCLRKGIQLPADARF